MFDKLDSNIVQKIWRTFFCLEVNNILNSQVLFVDFGRHGGIFSLDFFFHFAKAFVDCVWCRTGNFLFRREISCLFAQNFVVSVLRRGGIFFP